MIIEKGRPINTDGREERELRVYAMLDSLGIEYTRADHEPLYTMEQCEQVDRELGVSMCKNLFLCNRQKTVFYLLALPSQKPFHTKELSSQLSIARLSFAEPEHMLQHLDIKPGAVSIMGLMNDRDHCVNAVFDRDLLDCEYFGCHPCVNTSTLIMKTEDIFGKYLPHIGVAYKTVSLSQE